MGLANEIATGHESDTGARTVGILTERWGGPPDPPPSPLHLQFSVALMAIQPSRRIFPTTII
ncbi:hypothetical protein GCM10012275_32240 [Longimycelium tulufanense]|uniref:Uncharacterized protein n=1 Tax=Longimycelium tulufanense TaxID=907463 RepID=A0A8J3FUH1_9PSEU|nr:hypothetical protein GCM10012275_32240 [Longimycelium tulufanense]